MRIVPGTSSPVGHETLVISNVALGLTPAKYANGVLSAYITVENAPIRFWLDGSNPTNSEGILLTAGEAVELDSIEEITNFKAIAVSTDSTLNIIYNK
jgi:hypothetical protein